MLTSVPTQGSVRSGKKGQVGEPEFEDRHDDTLQEDDDGVSETSLLALGPQTNPDQSFLVQSSSSTASQGEELFTTALEPPPHLTPLTTSTITPPPSPSTPFLADSLRKIEQRRKALQVNHSQTLTTTPTHTTRPKKKTVPIEHLTLVLAQSHDQSHDHDGVTGYTTDAGIQPPSTAHCTDSTRDERAASCAVVKEDSTSPHPVNSSLVASHSFATEQTTKVPNHLHRLTNLELRQRLLDRGEQPGPVTDLTRSAYLIYLTKLEAGIQPAGNTGYKGQ